MTYTLRFFTRYGYKEELLETYQFDSMPYVPRKKDLITIDNEQYLVRRVAVDYEDNTFEIMLDIPDFDKEWWE